MKRLDKLSKTDTAYILAGLRCFQERLVRDGEAGSCQEHFAGLDEPEPGRIDDLCMFINFDYEGASPLSEDRLRFIERISRMTRHGEKVEGRPFDMTCDDAIATLNNLIMRARRLL